jgi:hypothetical protein
MRKKLFFHLTLLLLAFIMSCSEDSVGPVENTVRKSTVGAIHFDNPAQEYVGWGYDLTGNYADPNYRRGWVFKAHKLPQEWTDSAHIPNSAEVISYSGETVSEYLSTMSNKFEAGGKYKLFSGSVKVNFDQSYYSINKTSFATVQFKANKWTYEVISNRRNGGDLRSYMDEQAAKDINDDTKDFRFIFKTYGTHVITGVTMGARMDYSSTMVSSFNKTGKSLSVLTEADFKWATGSANAKNAYSSETERKEFQEYRQVRRKVWGGNSEYGFYMENTDQNSTFQDKFSPWLSSIDINNMVMNDFTENSMLPIWEFVSDSNSTRREYLKTSYEQYLKESQISQYDGNLPSRNCIIDIIVRTSKNSNMPETIDYNGNRYTKMDMDLNRKAKGDFIYLYYLYGSDSTTGSLKPITRLWLSQDKKEGKAKTLPGSNFELIDCDLNKGAGGHYIYLFVSRSKQETYSLYDPVTRSTHTTTKNFNPIRSLEIFNKSAGQTLFSDNLIVTGYMDAETSESGPLDLNYTVGGDFIYLLFSRD